MATHELQTPLTREVCDQLKAGDRVYLSGTLYTARDAAHARLVALLEEGKDLPFDPKGAVIYYVGPTPAPEGKPIGSAGPTTAYRMDPYAPAMLRAGEMGMVGKGKRSPEVIATMKETGAVYFAAIGGAGALLANAVKKAEIVCYEDLGAEAVRRLEVEHLPLVVAIDNQGTNLYELGPQEYLNSQE